MIHNIISYIIIHNIIAHEFVRFSAFTALLQNLVQKKRIIVTQKDVVICYFDYLNVFDALRPPLSQYMIL